ncbi:hypothetical protein E2C01_079604 [Portunus trituberculatus]|uniref:Uncharacterized protein n=1 Tax=Portunus trituberculatus TaxID=210409 RepID=A0A5B7IXG1_PORTR|nr:hypothetical protein [Portunus trituberculatus]
MDGRARADIYPSWTMAHQRHWASWDTHTKYGYFPSTRASESRPLMSSPRSRSQTRGTGREFEVTARGLSKNMVVSERFERAEFPAFTGFLVPGSNACSQGL